MFPSRSAASALNCSDLINFGTKDMVIGFNETYH